MSKRSLDQPVRVLIVEDSRSQREFLVGMVQAADGFAVAGTATNGHEAITATQRLRPEVVAMDINLPGLDGYEATRAIMQQCPTPVVMISGDARDEEQRSVQALAVGALAVVRKPRSLVAEGSAGERATLLRTLRLMADVRVVTRYPARQPVAAQPAGTRRVAQQPEIMAIAASTGGPAALEVVLRGLGPSFALPVLVAQHITRGFVSALHDWLVRVVPLPIHIAVAGDLLRPGHVYLAPDDHHLVVQARGTVAMQAVEPRDRYCPSADRLFHSVAGVYGSRSIGIILTGMGDDGARGLLALREAGGQTLAQDEASCVVYGMPKAAVMLGSVAEATPLAILADTARHLTLPLNAGAQHAP